MNLFAAALDLIRMADIHRTLGRRATAVDHLALCDARRRYEQARRRS